MDTYLLEKIKVNGEQANLITKSTGEHVSVTYRTNTTNLSSALSAIAQELDNTGSSATQSIYVGEGEPPVDMPDNSIFIRKIV